MKIDLQHNIETDPTFPIGPVRGYTDSSVFLEFCGIPDRISGCEVSAVSVTLVNADGAPISAPAERDGGIWRVLFAGTNFAAYGFIEMGAKVSLSLERPDRTKFALVVGFGNFEIKKACASAVPGDLTKTFVVKGSDVYLKTIVVDGVQHYIKQKMVNDPEIGWGAEWNGDYILVNGEFVEVADAE